MRIDELNLISFGKFENKHIRLDDGLNIIYGENEKGKSTVHAFIEGVFFGFLKPYTKRTLYKDDLEKYKPWNKNIYRGNMSVHLEGEDYIIEKNFNKGEEKTSVKLKLTGEDISKNVDLGSNKKVLQPGYHFFDFNGLVYNNTISVGQLNIKTEDKLQLEIRDRLLNMSNALDENISVENTVKKLDESIKKIGNKKGLKTLYGSKNKKILDLEGEKSKLLSSLKDYERLLDQLRLVEGKICEYEKNISKEREELNIYRYNYLDKKIYEARKIQENLDHLNFKKKDYEKFKDLEIDYYSRALKLENEIDNIMDKIKKQEESLNLLAASQGLREEKDSLNYEKLYEEWERFQKLEIRKANYLLDEENLNSRNHKLLILSASAFFLIISLISLYSQNYKLMGANIINILVIIYGLKNRRKYLEEKSNYDIYLQIEGRQKDILKKYNMENKEEFDSLLRKYRELEEDKRAYKIKADEGLERKRLLELEIKDLNIVLSKSRKDLSYLLGVGKAKDLDELASNIKKANLYVEYEREIKNKEILLNSILKESTLEELEKNKAQYDFKDIKNLKIKSLEEIQKKIKEYEECLYSEKIEAGKIKEKIRPLEDSFERLRDIEESIDLLKVEIEDLDLERQALELARNTIESLSKKIQVEHAPNINKRVSSIINQITDGKYDEVKIDEKLNISVLNRESNDIIDIEKLSKGTIDQLYLALRMGIVNSIETSPLPIILDDSFIQYDDYRLKNILKFLALESKKRQILLFTCQKREVKILADEGIKCNLINL